MPIEATIAYEAEDWSVTQDWLRELCKKLSMEMHGPCYSISWKAEAATGRLARLQAAPRRARRSSLRNAREWCQQRWTLHANLYMPFVSNRHILQRVDPYRPFVPLVLLSDRLVASVCAKCCRYLRRKVFGKSHRFHDSMLF